MNWLLEHFPFLRCPSLCLDEQCDLIRWHLGWHERERDDVTVSWRDPLKRG